MYQCSHSGLVDMGSSRSLLMARLVWCTHSCRISSRWRGRSSTLNSWCTRRLGFVGRSTWTSLGQRWTVRPRPVWWTVLSASLIQVSSCLINWNRPRNPSPSSHSLFWLISALPFGRYPERHLKVFSHVVTYSYHGFQKQQSLTDRSPMMRSPPSRNNYLMRTVLSPQSIRISLKHLAEPELMNQTTLWPRP